MPPAWARSASSERSGIVARAQRCGRGELEQAAAAQLVDQLLSDALRLRRELVGNELEEPGLDCARQHVVQVLERRAAQLRVGAVQGAARQPEGFAIEDQAEQAQRMLD